jgi:hypothetical protein
MLAVSGLCVRLVGQRMNTLQISSLNLRLALARFAVSFRATLGSFSMHIARQSSLLVSCRRSICSNSR